jgi:ATP-dependent Clp endopeptidase proteolytic subunit ClpP
MQNWYNIKNTAKDTADIFIYSEVGGYDINAQSFIEELKDLKDKNLNIHINSLGGSVFDGMAIYNALKNHKNKVTTKVEGIAASIASVIAMAGDTIEMAENSLFMIHNPFTMAGGDAGELRKTADILDKIRDEIANIYASKSAQDIDTLVGLMNVETWFNANETIDSGFANEITKAVKVENSYDLSKFNNITEDKVNQIINNSNLIKTENMAKKETELKEKSLLEKIKSLVSSDIKADHEPGHEGEESEAEETDWAKTYEEMKDRVENLETAVHRIEEQLGTKEEEMNQANTEIANKVGELETATTEIENLNSEISKLKASGTELSKENDPAIVENKATDGNLAFFNAMADSIKKRA